MKRICLWAMMLTGCLCACRQRPLFYVYQPLPSGEWHTMDTLCFELAEVPADGRYQVSVGVRTTNLYPYEDLWLVVERRDADDSRHRDTLCLQVNGEQGTGGLRRSGQQMPVWQTAGTVIHECEDSVATLDLTVQRMPVRLLIYHLMRRQSLTGISDVGVKVQ